ncbi:MAG: ADP-ribosylglycohydrolase family protein [Bacteroidales bacterium]|nr:ADP-ribosylglycohydrolase family protein [Bacteroidales bacterium]
MLGALIGDTIGSVYEFHNIKTTEFPLFSTKSTFTDDSVMTMAVAEWLLKGKERTMDDLEDAMVSLARRFPNRGYGGGFYRWLFFPNELRSYDGQRSDGLRHPYGSFGNGSAMRVSAVGWFYDTLEETEFWAKKSAEITHNHPEGIKGALATAAAIYMARTGSTKEDIREYIVSRYGYDLSRTCDEIRPTYRFNETCQGTVPQAIVAFLESTDFESCIRLGVSLGGDTDTLCAIAGTIAEAFYGSIPEQIVKHEWELLPEVFHVILRRCAEMSHYRLPKGL